MPAATRRSRSGGVSDGLVDLDAHDGLARERDLIRGDLARERPAARARSASFVSM